MFDLVYDMKWKLIQIVLYFDVIHCIYYLIFVKTIAWVLYYIETVAISYIFFKR